jgi:lysophospholipase L1-like esterase
MREAVQRRIDGGDERVRFVDGLPIVRETQLADGIHPNDEGHHALAAAFGPVLKAMVS